MDCRLTNAGRTRYGAGQLDIQQSFNLLGSPTQEALLWMLCQTLGDSFNAEARIAWMHMLNMLARVMQEAAAAERLALILI